MEKCFQVTEVEAVQKMQASSLTEHPRGEIAPTTLLTYSLTCSGEWRA